MSLLFSICACKGAEYRRQPRQMWMQLFPFRRLYRCTVCHDLVFAPKDQVVTINRQRTREAWMAAGYLPER